MRKTIHAKLLRAAHNFSIFNFSILNISIFNISIFQSSIFQFSIFQFSIILLLSCENVSCPLNNTVESVYGFYAALYDDSGELLTGNAVSVGDTLTVTLLGADSVILNRQVNQNGMKLPVSFYEDTDAVEFTFTDTLSRVGRDTLWIHKRNTHHWDDPSCPVHMWHQVLDIRSTHHLIDTVLVTNASINYDGLENFQIYFRVAQ